jgi:hypothetical protein
MRRFLAILAPIVTLAALAPLSACDHVKRVATGLEYTVTSSADALAGRKEREEPRLFAVAGPIGIDIESFGGDVIIDVDEEYEHLELVVTRRAIHGYGRRDEADASLEQISYTAEFVPGELGQVLQIRATTTHAEPYFQRLEIRIKAPEIEGVKVHTRNGDVHARRIRGAVDIATDDGDVRVMTPYPMHERVNIVNNAGDIDFRIRGESAGTIDGESTRGSVLARVERGTFIVHPSTSFNRLRGTLNDGENEFSFRTIDGDVRIAVVKAPTKVGRMIFD